MPIVDGHLVIDGYTYPGGDGSSKSDAIQVNTFKRLMDADNDTDITQKYIKIVENLNPSQEDFFTGFVYKTSWKNYIYCDENNRKTINGLIVSGNSFITHSINATQGTLPGFYNTDFTNCVFYPTQNSPIIGTGMSGSSNLFFLFSGSTLSLRIASSYSSIYLCGVSARYTGSSVYIEGPKSLVSMIIVDRGAFYQSNFVIQNAMFDIGSSTGTYQQCSFVFKNCNLGAMSNLISNWNPTQTYFAFTNCTYANSTYTLASTQTICVATDATPYPFVKNTSSGTNTILLATMVDSTDPDFNTSSIKSKQFLVDNGFIP